MKVVGVESEQDKYKKLKESRFRIFRDVSRSIIYKIFGVEFDMVSKYLNKLKRIFKKWFFSNFLWIIIILILLLFNLNYIIFN